MLSLEVRPIHISEHALWRDLMQRHHYLGFQKLVGERILYIATLSGKWVALLAWAAAAWKCGPRDRWIGWSHIVRFKRLPFVANNIRFLILPDTRIHNLASQILSKNLKRLSSDWEKFHGHSISLAETFVDPSRFEGTCYKAANWLSLGMTSGFGRCQGGYFAHGQPKKVFVYPLHPKARAVLSNPYVETKKRKEKTLMIDVHKLPIEGRGGLIDVLKTVADTRSRLGMRYSLLTILAISTCAMLSGARGYKGIAQWARKLTPSQLKKFRCHCKTPPSETTFRRVLQGLDADPFDQIINSWLSCALKGKAIAIDGKTLRGSHDGETKALHLLSALLHEEKIVVAQKAVGTKTNEIPEVRNLLAPLNIEGAVITVDALNTQVETATCIVREKKADFVMPVKDNQPLLKQELEGLDYEAFSPSGDDEGSRSSGNAKPLSGQDSAA